MFKRTFLALSGIIFLLVLGVGILRAGEKVSGEEAEKVRSTIESYVKQDSNLKGGFLIYDEKEKIYFALYLQADLAAKMI